MTASASGPQNRATITMDPYILECAKTAADRAGQTLSKWLNDAVQAKLVRQDTARFALTAVTEDTAEQREFDALAEIEMEAEARRQGAA